MDFEKEAASIYAQIPESVRMGIQGEIEEVMELAWADGCSQGRGDGLELAAQFIEEIERRTTGRIGVEPLPWSWIAGRIRELAQK